jgi:hypothetical protein
MSKKYIWLFLIVLFAAGLSYALYGQYNLWRNGIPNSEPETTFSVDIGDLLPNQSISLKGNVFSVNNGILSFDVSALLGLNLSFDPIDFFPKNTVEYQPWGIHKTTYNNDSLRAEKNFSNEKGNLTRIILLGDSMVWGAWVSDNETSSYFLQERMDPSAAKIEVINLGVYMLNTKMEIERLKRKGLKYSPDIVVLFYFSNDIDNSSITIPLDVFLDKFLIDNKIPRGIRIRWQARLAVVEAQDFSKSFLEFVQTPLMELKTLAENKFGVVLVAFPSPIEHINRLRGIADSNSWDFIELENEIGYGQKGNWSTWDGHPSKYANMRIAEYLAWFLKNKSVVN